MAEASRDNSIIIISPQAADRLIAAHDGDVALLYIYRLRTGCTGHEQAARDLCRTLREIEAADEKLSRLALFDGGAQGASPAPVQAAPRPFRRARSPPRRLSCRSTARRISSAAAGRTGSSPR